MAQKWVWPKKSSKQNLERVSGNWGILHDVGFSGAKTYRAGIINSNNSFSSKSETLYKRSEALDYIKQHATQSNPRKRTTSPTLLPVKISVNPRTGRVRVFASPAVAAKLKSGRSKSNPYNSDFGQKAWEAGKRWSSQASDSGVANARVVRYGFLKWWNSLSPTTTKGIRQSSAEKDFRQGYKIGKR